MYSSAQISWPVRAWFWASVVLNALSLGALLDRLLNWPSPLSGFLRLEQQALNLLWHWLGFSAVLESPVLTVVSQMLVFMGGVYAAANYYALRTEGQSVTQRIHDTSCRQTKFPWICAYVKSFGLYLAGPILLPLVLVKACLRRSPTQRIWGFTFRPSHIAAYYSAVIIGVTAMLGVANLLSSSWII